MGKAFSDEHLCDPWVAFFNREEMKTGIRLWHCLIKVRYMPSTQTFGTEISRASLHLPAALSAWTKSNGIRGKNVSTEESCNYLKRGEDYNS